MAQKRPVPPVLPDLLSPGLLAVFCGTAPGHRSAAEGHYYAHPQNKFWRILQASGLTPSLLAPSQFRELTKLRLGLTDIAKNDAGMDRDLRKESLGPAATRALEKRIRINRPNILAFTSLTGGRHFLGQRVELGCQSDRIGPTQIWILPSPSPTAQWNWNEKVWYALAAEIRRQKDNEPCAIAS